MLADTIRQTLGPYARPLLRRFQATPMKKVVRELDARGVPLRDLQAVEIFGGDGSFHTLDYARRVAGLEVWEFDPAMERSLRRNLPFATIKITDSYRELRETPRTFGLVVADNPLSTFAQARWCEHFELFPDVFRIFQEQSYLILNVEPELDPADLKHIPYLFNPDQLARRRQFYTTDHPEKIPLGELAEFYRRLFRANGFEIEWHFFVKRPYIYYFVAKVAKSRLQPD